MEREFEPVNSAANNYVALAAEDGQNAEAVSGEWISCFKPLGWVFEASGLWPHKESNCYYVWTLFWKSSYVGVVAWLLHWWRRGEASYFTLSKEPGASIAEIAYFVQMAVAYWTIRYTLRKRGHVFLGTETGKKGVFEDEKLYASFHKVIIASLLFVLAYLLWSFGTYVVLYNMTAEVQPPLRKMVIISTFFYNVPFGASNMLYLVACLHVFHQIQLLTRDLDTMNDDGIRIESVHMLKERAELVWDKLHQLGKCFNIFLSVNNFCCFIKGAAWMSMHGVADHFDSSPFSQQWKGEGDMFARIFIDTLVLNVAAALVVKEAKKIQPLILKWRLSGAEVGDVTAQHEHNLLVQYAEQCDRKAFRSLAVFGIPLTWKNGVHAVYVLAAAVVKYLWVEPNERKSHTL